MGDIVNITDGGGTTQKKCWDSQEKIEKLIQEGELKDYVRRPQAEIRAQARDDQRWDVSDKREVALHLRSLTSFLGDWMHLLG